MRLNRLSFFVAIGALLFLAGCATAATQSSAAVPAPTKAQAQPETHEPTATQAATRVPQTTQAPVYAENRLIVLDWPQEIRESDGDYITLSLILNENGTVTITPESPGHQSEGQSAQIPDVYDTHNIDAVARLDMAGLDTWRDEIRESLRPGKPVVFRWALRGEEAGKYQGVVWLYLDFIPKSGGPPERVTLLSKPIQVNVVTVFGLPGWIARYLGGAGILVSTVLGYPFIQKLFEGLRFARTKTPHHEA